MGLNSLKFLPMLTGGELKLYAGNDLHGLENDLRVYAGRLHAYHCLARLRVSHEASAGYRTVPRQAQMRAPYILSFPVFFYFLDVDIIFFALASLIIYISFLPF